jgi:hypothetical protein
VLWLITIGRWFMSTPESLSLDPALAIRLCEEVQKGQLIKVFTQCWGCTTFSKGDPAKMCGEVVACNLVMARYQRLKEQGKL